MNASLCNNFAKINVIYLLLSFIYYSFLDIPAFLQDVRLGSNHLKPILPSHEGGTVSEGCSSPDTCNNNPCPRNSICKRSWLSHDCDCNKGYYGARCIDVCTLNPCTNNGTCVHDVNAKRGYRCDCKGTKFTGESCSLNDLNLIWFKEINRNIALKNVFIHYCFHFYVYK